MTIRFRMPVLAAIAIVAVVTALVEPAFLNLHNLANILAQSTALGFVAVGMTYVIIGGGIDLSVGSTLALSSVVLGIALRSGSSALVAIALSVLAGMLVGTANGLLVSRAGLAPFLATLGLMGVARGAAFLLSGGQPISGYAENLAFLYRAGWLVEPAVYLFGISIVIGTLVLTRTVWGTRLYAVGSNERAAVLSGIDVRGVQTASYLIAGATAGIAGVLITARLNSAQPLAGSLYELDAIAATVIGGGSLNGGRGDLLGTLLGVLLIAELRNAVTITGLPSHSHPLVIGILLIIAVVVDAKQNRIRP